MFSAENQMLVCLIMFFLMEKWKQTSEQMFPHFVRGKNMEAIIVTFHLGENHQVQKINVKVTLNLI